MQNKVPALSSVLSLLTLHYHPLEETDAGLLHIQ